MARDNHAEGMVFRKRFCTKDFPISSIFIPACAINNSNLSISSRAWDFPEWLVHHKIHQFHLYFEAMFRNFEHPLKYLLQSQILQNFFSSVHRWPGIISISNACVDHDSWDNLPIFQEFYQRDFETSGQLYVPAGHPNQDFQGIHGPVEFYFRSNLG